MKIEDKQCPFNVPFKELIMSSNYYPLYHCLPRANSLSLNLTTSIPCFIALHRLTRFVFALRMEGFWQRCIDQIYRHHFPTAFAHFMSVSHFGNSYSVSNFFIIIIFVVVILDVTTTTCSSLNAEHFFSNKVCLFFLIKVYKMFRHGAIAHLMDNSIV